jgi:hypothetical protein
MCSESTLTFLFTEKLSLVATRDCKHCGGGKIKLRLSEYWMTFHTITDPAVQESCITGTTLEEVLISFHVDLATFSIHSCSCIYNFPEFLSDVAPGARVRCKFSAKFGSVCNLAKMRFFFFQFTLM